MDDNELWYINRKGGTVLANKAHLYYKVKIFKNTAVLWRCSEYKKKKCSGNIIVKNGKVLKKKEHSCESDMSKIWVLQEVEALKNKVQESDLPVPTLYKDAVNNLENAGINMVTELPSLSSMQHNLYDIRNKSLGVKKTVYGNFEEVEVPNKFAGFVLADYLNQGLRIIVFCSKQAKKLIGEVTEYFADATFASCPPPFYQFYSIHGDVGSQMTKTKVMPLIYILMPNKKQETYLIAYELIKEHLPNFNPKIMHLDFEQGAINAILQTFPQVTLRGCYYHWNRAIWKKAKKIGLKSKGEKRITGLVAALPLLPDEHIREGLEYAKSESIDTKKMTTFFKYVESYWFHDNFNKILSVFGERHRTNNIVESFHSKLKKDVNQRNTTVLRLLKVVTEIEGSTNTKDRKKIYIDNDDHIMNIQLQLINNEISVGFALEKLR